SFLRENLQINLGEGLMFALRLQVSLLKPSPASLQSIVRIVFHDRRLQYMEHQQLEGWRWNRPGDRILDVVLPVARCLKPQQPQQRQPSIAHLPQLTNTMFFHREDTQQWLHRRRFSPFSRLFSSFSGADLLRMSREDLIQICGLADGIRLFNAMKGR
ncbi:hypothetical protein GOODEAATRI_010012, partial [Goodea atripinnis]